MRPTTAEAGQRLLLGSVPSITRRGRDHTATFPGIAATVATLPAKSVVLDGEVCVFDDTLVSQFYWLTDDAEPGAVVTPPMYAVFDCPYLHGRDLRQEPLSVRRKALETTLGDRQILLFAARRLAADGLEAWVEVDRRGLEGLVAKHEASAYRGGERSSLWLKVKRREEGQFVVGGITKDRGGWTTLLLGVVEDGGLRHVGGVRFGVTRRLVAQLFESGQAAERATSPFTDYRERGATWLEPRLVVEVSFGGSVERGLRDPALRRFVNSLS
jgi:bifunctional non-homologous end joining protein LigD